jgi:membrane associated rhomboid family serine protease
VNDQANLPWHDPQWRPTGPPALGWEVPAREDYLATPKAAAAVLAADIRGKIAWIRQPGDAIACTPYEVSEPAMAAAIRIRDRQCLQARGSEQRSQLLLWLFVGGMMVLPSYLSTPHQGHFWLFMLMFLFLAPPAIRLWQLHRSRRSLERDWSAYARDQSDHILAAAWLAKRDRIHWLAWSLATGIALVSIAGLILHRLDAADVDRTRILTGESWRLLTGPILHGGVLHGVMNLTCWIWLATWCAALFGRPVVVPAFLMSMLLGSLATITIGSGQPSVGISGGLMGLIGVLAFAAWRWRDQSPPGLRATVALNLLLIAGIGVVGIGIVDNAAHLGGLLGGLLCGWWTVPAGPGPRASGTAWAWIERIAVFILSAAILGAGWLVWYLPS